MDKKVLLQLLKHRVNEIETTLETFEQSRVIHEIENDILLSKIRLLYEDVKLLSNVELPPEQLEDIQVPQAQAAPQVQAQMPASPPPPPMIADEVNQDEPIVSQEINETKEIILPPEPIKVPEPVKTTEPVKVPEPVKTPEQVKATEPVKVPEQVKTPEPVEVPEQVKTPEPVEVQEQERGLQRELDSIPTKSNPNGNILTGVKMQAVDDIMVAIGLNDRFLFTRELFDNDAELFEKTITSLNKKQDWDEAFIYLNEKFDWDFEDPTLILFISFVKRRYI